MTLVKNSPNLVSGHSLLTAYMHWRWQHGSLCENTIIHSWSWLTLLKVVWYYVDSYSFFFSFHLLCNYLDAFRNNILMVNITMVATFSVVVNPKKSMSCGTKQKMMNEGWEIVLDDLRRVLPSTWMLLWWMRYWELWLNSLGSGICFINLDVMRGTAIMTMWLVQNKPCPLMPEKQGAQLLTWDL